MTAADAVKAVLVADTGAGGVATLMTGGIYTFEDTGRKGLDRTSPVAANVYDGTTKKLKPTVIIHARGDTPRDEAKDVEAQFTAVKEVAEIYFYNDGDAGYSVIRQAKDRAYTLLAEKRFGGFWGCKYAGTFDDERAAELVGAATIRSNYELTAPKGGT